MVTKCRRGDGESNDMTVIEVGKLGGARPKFRLEMGLCSGWIWTYLQANLLVGI